MVVVLPRAVGAEQAVDRSARYLKRQLANSDEVAEALDDLADVDCQIRHEVGFLGEQQAEDHDVERWRKFPPWRAPLFGAFFKP